MKLTFERTLVRHDYMLLAVPIGQIPILPTNWINGVVRFSNGGIKGDDPWWDLLQMQGRVRITVELINLEFTGP